MTTHTFHIQTFGCQMNVSDSDWLARSLTSRGFAQGEFADASLYIINTCSVRDKPEQKLYSELGRIARDCRKQGRTGVTVCVGGCVAQHVGPKLAKRFPQVRLIFGTDGIAQAPEAIIRLMEDASLRLNLLEFVDHYEERADIWSASPESGAESRKEVLAEVPEIPPGVFVNIMQGCNNFCTYCIVPYVRGRQKSRNPEAVLAECRALLARGAREITLLGQNVNSYGQDGQVRDTTFTDLLHKVAALPGLERLRFMTPHPKDIAPEVIDAFATMDVLCPRLHLPLQSGSDRILDAMGRRYDTDRYLSIVRRLKAARPDIMLSTDIIVGFPGETEEDFQATMDIVREVGFVASYSFVYSDRPHAKAALLPGKVERAVALERLERLQAWQNQATENILTSLQRQEHIVLLEGRSRRAVVLGNSTDEKHRAVGEYWQGKTPHGLVVKVTLPPRFGNACDDFAGADSRGNGCPGGGWKGALLPVRIEAADRHSLKGRQAGTPW